MCGYHPTSSGRGGVISQLYPMGVGRGRGFQLLPVGGGGSKFDYSYLLNHGANFSSVLI